MQLFSLITALFLCANGFSQSILIIDKSEETELVFNHTTPLSFLDIIISDTSSVIELMNKDTYEYVVAQKQEQNLSFYQAPYSNTPLIDENGDPLILVDDEGNEQYAFYREEGYFDVQGISRIILEFDKQGELQKIHLAKKYAKKEKFLITYSLNKLRKDYLSILPEGIVTSEKMLLSLPDVQKKLNNEFIEVSKSLLNY